MSFSQFLQYLFSGITSGSIYALTALGFTLIYNATDIINLAQGEFVMLGGLMAVSLHRFGLSLPLSVVGAIGVVTLLGIAFELLAIRPLLRAGVMAQIIVTVGAALALRTAAMIFWGRDALSLPSFSGDNPLRVLGGTILPQTLWVVCLTLLILVVLQFFYRKTIMGKAVRACSVNAVAARLMGISYKRVVLISFAVSAAISAAGGVLLTPISFMSYSMGSMIGLKGFAAAVLGGLGNPVGAVLGGFAIGIIEALSVGVMDAGYKDAVAFVILLLVLFVRPTGLLGSRSAEKV